MSLNHASRIPVTLVTGFLGSGKTSPEECKARAKMLQGMSLYLFLNKEASKKLCRRI